MKMSTFQIIVTGLFAFFLIAGVGVFAAFGGLLGGKGTGVVVIWGTEDSDTMSNLLTTLRSSNKAFAGVSYVQKKPATYDAELLNAMASGQGPDLFLISQDQAYSFEDKITPIPYSAVSQAQFIDSFIDEGQLFLTPNGALALPFSIDPLVMYWNRDLYATAGIASAPVYWNDFLTIAPKITSLDAGSNVSQSAVALGTWQNITNAKDILATLFMQAGDSITAANASGSTVSVFGATPANAPTNPAESALRFYTEFADPSKTSYSWNSSLAQSSNAFTSGDLATYFGFASEYATLAATNPNLSFGVSVLPQLQGNSTQITFGQLTGVAISRTASNPQGALTVAEVLTGQQAISLLAQAVPLPPVRRDVSVDTSNNAPMQVFVESSLIAHAWLDPAPAQTDTIFQTMINEVLSGASAPAAAVGEASQALGQLFSGQIQ
ncbi:MAG TPA: extracellular solute-binding protein [Candidatus Paceibacterota bacterium]|nr:extracellular solute-binding protein [Candidatus Paceibacterota bacterium]